MLDSILIKMWFAIITMLQLLQFNWCTCTFIVNKFSTLVEELFFASFLRPLWESCLSQLQAGHWVLSLTRQWVIRSHRYSMHNTWRRQTVIKSFRIFLNDCEEYQHRWLTAQHAWSPTAALQSERVQLLQNATSAIQPPCLTPSVVSRLYLKGLDPFMWAQDPFGNV